MKIKNIYKYLKPPLGSFFQPKIHEECKHTVWNSGPEESEIILTLWHCIEVICSSVQTWKQKTDPMGFIQEEGDGNTVNGRNPAITSWGEGSLSHYFQGFIQVVQNFWPINSICKLFGFSLPGNSAIVTFVGMGDRSDPLNGCNVDLQVGNQKVTTWITWKCSSLSAKWLQAYNGNKSCKRPSFARPRPSRLQWFGSGIHQRPVGWRAPGSSNSTAEGWNQKKNHRCIKVGPFQPLWEINPFERYEKTRQAFGP